MGSIKKKRRKKMSKHKYDKRMKAQRHKNKEAKRPGLQVRVFASRWPTSLHRCRGSTSR